MKKENIQSRNRKLSAKARKKHTFAPVSDMLKPLEKMYASSCYAGMHAAMGTAAHMTPYYMPQSSSTAAAAAAAATTAASAQSFAGASAAAGMYSAALGGFGAAASFGGMVSQTDLLRPSPAAKTRA